MRRIILYNLKPNFQPKAEIRNRAEKRFLSPPPEARTCSLGDTRGTVSPPPCPGRPNRRARARGHILGSSRAGGPCCADDQNATLKDPPDTGFAANLVDLEQYLKIRGYVLHFLELSMSPFKRVTSRKELKIQQKMQIITITGFTQFEPKPTSHEGAVTSFLENDSSDFGSNWVYLLYYQIVFLTIWTTPFLYDLKRPGNVQNRHWDR